MTHSPAGARPWVWHSVAIAGAVIGLLTLAVVSSASRRAGRPSLALQNVGSPPSPIIAGGRITLTGKVRNRSGESRVGRITVRLRGAGTSLSGRVAARKQLKRLSGGRRARFKIAGVVPRTLPAGRYRVIVCLSTGRKKTGCKYAKRTLRVIAPTSPAWPPRPAGWPPLPVPAPVPAQWPSAPPREPSTPPEGTVSQTIDGFGTSARTFTDPHVFDVQDAAPTMSSAQQAAVLDALYVELGLTRIRPIQPDTTAGPPPVGIEIANDDFDPLSTDLARFSFEGRRLDDYPPVVARAKERGVSVAWNSPLNREPWMGVSPGTDDAAEYAEWLLAQVRRFSQGGARLDYISIVNEPSYSRNPMSGAFIRDVVKNLGPRLDAEGLLVPFVIPDDVRASSGAAEAAVVLADPIARGYVGALATHLYDEPLDNLAAMRSLAKGYDLPLWMSEFSVGAINTTRPSGSPAAEPLDWALLMHDLLVTYDVTAVDYLWGYSGEPDRDQTSLVRLDHDGTTYRGFTRTKAFYYFGQYSRFIRPGALRVDMTSSKDSIKASAYHHDRTRTIVAINPGPTEATTTLKAADLAGVDRLTRTRTSPTENWTTPPAVPVSGTSITVTLPPQSVTTLTGTKG